MSLSTDEKRRQGKSNRRRGVDLEHAVRDDLRELGWLVIRPAGSKGAADLVAHRAGDDPAFVQVKTGGYMKPDERRELLAAATQAGGVPVLADRQRHREDRRRTFIRYQRLVDASANEWERWEPWSSERSTCSS